MLGGPHPVSPAPPPASRDTMWQMAAHHRWRPGTLLCGAQVAVLFTDSSLGEVRNFNVLNRALHDIAQHHPEKVNPHLVLGLHDGQKLRDCRTARS
jgi:hypothetical protein